MSLDLSKIYPAPMVAKGDPLSQLYPVVSRNQQIINPVHSFLCTAIIISDHVMVQAPDPGGSGYFGRTQIREGSYPGLVSKSDFIKSSKTVF